MVKRRSKILILILTFIASHSFGQDFLFLGEGRESEVRLFWIPKKSWPRNIEGVNIKRRTKGSNWELLNQTIIQPGTQSGKSLANIGLSAADIARLDSKKQQLVQTGRLNEIKTPEFINLLRDENTLQGVSVLLNSDYDKALVAGFGYIDNNISERGEIEYGLFKVSQDGQESSEPDAIFQWTFGTFPIFEISMEGSVKTNKKRALVELKWKVDIDSYKQYPTLNGFNVYRKEGETEFIKLNETPIWVSQKEKTATLYYKDDSLDIEKIYTYGAAPNTIFNTRGTLAEIEASFIEVQEVNPPSLDTLNKQGNNLELKWNFDQSNEGSIKGFYVQLKNDQNQFDNISDLLPLNARSYSFDQLNTPDDQYYHFRVVAVRIDDLELWSNRKIYLNRKETRPSTPVNLNFNLQSEGVSLSWGQPEVNSECVVGYYLYTSSPNEERLVKEGSIDIQGTIYTYSIYTEKSATYRFAVSAYNQLNEESLLSDTLVVTIPSRSLPFINIWPISQEAQTVSLNWKYPEDIADLEGFRLYQNDQLIADEQTLTAEMRSWRSSALEPGKYTYEIIAVSRTDVQSEKSKPRVFEIK